MYIHHIKALKMNYFCRCTVSLLFVYFITSITLYFAAHALIPTQTTTDSPGWQARGFLEGAIIITSIQHCMGYSLLIMSYERQSSSHRFVLGDGAILTRAQHAHGFDWSDYVKERAIF